MTSFIITSTNRSKREEKAQQLCTDAQIAPIDITTFSKPTEETKGKAKKLSQSIGIEDIKQLQQKLFLTPIKSKTKAVVITDADTLTLEAQNALLKVLEEPPAHTLIMLLASSTEFFLPTILSRCQIITLQEEQKVLTDEEKKVYTDILTKLPSLTIADSLEYAEKVGKNREEALQWLEKLMLTIREQLIEAEQPQKYVVILHGLQQAYTRIKTTNANQRLTLENLFLSFVK